ncbi:MAG: hypothetical protein UY48_C0013G0018 [Candidatus Gottesmanbacteria bacterium GW2011_GWB1_49_7]|uniref:Uncharacterized protein n=1 Tax=Candidatus Gottesmanbacteria bacterium GW2011_GWB1_49_7 TaxID=1618448 RepID=A0A0G1YA06_9BACT|nr:MAG: hypothetical protein UY48_C0013G0018 [Candidatus Gottesmanbacteria bacterium GW2011_GWB1_49_7]
MDEFNIVRLTILSVSFLIGFIGIGIGMATELIQLIVPSLIVVILCVIDIGVLLKTIKLELK